MRRFVLVAVAAAVIGSLGAPGVSGAQPSPTLTLEEACAFDGAPLYGVTVSVSGVAPNSTVSGSVAFPDGSGIAGSIVANELGVASITLFTSAPGVISVTITSPFSTTQSLEVDCLPNNKDECKNGGWQDFGIFKNQGDCVSFVATGGKNPPAGSTPP